MIISRERRIRLGPLEAGDTLAEDVAYRRGTVVCRLSSVSDLRRTEPRHPICVGVPVEDTTSPAHALIFAAQCQLQCLRRYRSAHLTRDGR